MAYPTPAQIDAAVPVAGTPSRALTNAALKSIVSAASYLPADGSVPTRSVANADFSGGRLKATPATDPDDCVTKVQLDNYEVKAATTTTFGGVKLGAAAVQTVTPAAPTATASRSYSVQLTGSGAAVVNVPWTNTTYSAATTTAPGLMSATDKTKLDGLPAGGTLTPTAAPTIAIGDPVDDENVQASFDALIAALKTAGVLT